MRYQLGSIYLSTLKRQNNISEGEGRRADKDKRHPPERLTSFSRAGKSQDKSIKTGTGHRAQGKGHRAQSDERRVKGEGQRAQSADGYWHLFYIEILHILNKMVFLFF